MTTEDLEAIRQWIEPHLDAIMSKIDDLKQTVERTDERSSVQITQLYDENKNIRDLISKQETVLRNEITQYASGSRAKDAEHETRITILESWRENGKEGRVNWIQIVLIMVSIFGVAISSFIALSMGHVGGR